MTPKTDKRRTNQRELPAGLPDTVLYGKIPPNAKTIETAVLGAMLISKRASAEILDLLKPEMFYVDAHRVVFEAILQLSKLNRAIDTETVIEELKRQETLEAAGNEYGVIKLTNSVVSDAHLAQHAWYIQDKFKKRELIRMGGELIQMGYDEATESAEIIEHHEKQFTALTTSSGDRYSRIDDGLVRVIQRVVEMRNKPSDITGVPSGFADIDRVTHGWQKQDLIILAARPSVGKTAFALNIASNAAKAGTPVSLFCLEMSMVQLVSRILSADSEVWLERITTGKVDDNHMRMLYSPNVQNLSQAPLFIDDTPSLTMIELRGKARRMKRKHNTGLIIIDYLQLMGGDTNVSANREREISQISRGLKQLAKELDIPIIALSQLSRAVETRSTKDGAKTPQLSDLRESGAIEQDADMVMFLYRPEYYDTNPLDENVVKGETQVTISKHRNGRLAIGRESIKLRADLAIQKFYDWDHLQDAYQSIPKNLSPGNWRPVKDIEKDDSGRGDLPF